MTRYNTRPISPPDQFNPIVPPCKIKPSSSTVTKNTHNVLPLIENVKKRLHAEYRARNLPAKDFVTARVTQIYETGAAIYFYYGFYFKDVPHPAQVYKELENIAREEILRSGGSLSHHHGVGKIRRAFLPAIMSPAALEWKRELKRSLDPDNIFGAGNQ